MFPATKKHMSRVNGEMIFVCCRVCGIALDWRKVDQDRPHTYRCDRHVDKNPCAVDGCERCHGAKGHLNDGSYWLCRDHWRLACPPKSKWRRVHNRFFATAKKLGCSRSERWPEALENRYWRYFGGLVARARRLSAGDLDMTEINALFGWTDDET